MQRPPRSQIFGIDIDSYTCDALLANFNKGVLVTPNVDHLMLLRKHEAMRAAYAHAEFVTVDSQILYWALKFLDRPVPEKISGSDFLPRFCAFHANRKTGVKAFILGGAHGVADRAMQNLNNENGYEIIIAAHSPSMNFANDQLEQIAVCELIKASGANCLIVGLGAPKQEVWIHENRHRLTSINQFLAVGAAIDFAAGNIPRAPEWMSRSGMEWLFRLLKEPKRLWKRYLVRDPLFFALLLKEKLDLFPRKHSQSKKS